MPYGISTNPNEKPKFKPKPDVNITQMKRQSSTKCLMSLIRKLNSYKSNYPLCLTPLVVEGLGGFEGAFGFLKLKEVG